MKRIIMTLTIAAMGLFYAGTAGAFLQGTTATMNIGVNHLSGCTVATTPMDFGANSYIVHLTTTSTITVNCSSGVPYRIDIDAGLNPGVPNAWPRRLKTGTAPADATNTVNYILSWNSDYVNGEWGDNGNTYCTSCVSAPTGVSGTGTGLDDLHTLYGYLDSYLDSPVGLLTDTVTVTVNY